MIEVRRLLAVGAILSLAVVAYTHVWGEPGDGKGFQPFGPGNGRNQTPEKIDRRFAEDLKVSRFAKMPVVTYETPKGETLFALQIQPRLPDPPDRPRDYLVMIDTSASKARGPLQAAGQITRELIHKLRPQDRLALWTVNVTARNLSRGFRAKRDLEDALSKLDREFPAGAVNLKEGLAQAAESFEGQAGRQRVLLFLGDGKSVAGPVDEDDRADLSAALVKKQVAFFSIPLGLRAEPANLHGFANATGGTVVRLNAKDNLDSFLDKLVKTVAEPVFYPDTFKLPACVLEHFPTQLPPLRRDTPTLVVGKLEPGKEIAYSLAGQVAGKELTVKRTEKVPEARPEHFFLVNVVGQWQSQKDRPALIQADRALAFAYEKNQLARADLLAKAGWALEDTHFDEARRLFQQTLDLDPQSAEAKGGKVLVEDLRKNLPVELLGKKDEASKKKLRQLVQDALRDRLKFEKGDKVTRVGPTGHQVVARAQPVPPEGAAPPSPADEVRRRRAIADQQANRLVNETITEANRLVRVDPDGAYELLKQTQENIRDNPDLSTQMQVALADRLGRAMDAVAREGRIVKRNQAEALALQAQADARRELTREREEVERRIRARLRVFHNLMNQARELEAYQQAEAIREDLVTEGLPVPPAVTAAYDIGLRKYHLEELLALKRIREERWLATMLQVEKSHVPFPDEPPVEYPAPAVWKQLTDLRRKRYEMSTFGAELPQRSFELRDALLNTVRFEGFDDAKTTLVEALDVLARRYNVSFDVNEKAFQVDQVMDVLKSEIANPNPIPPMNATLGTVLKKILSRIPAQSGATYLIRKDQIEITTGTFAAAEKAVRVYPVADLVIPIPNSINQQAALQGLSILGTGALGGFGIGGLGALGALGAGGLGALGALGAGGLGALGALGGGLGALGALGGGLGALGALGGGLGALGGALGGGALGALGAGGALGVVGALGAGGNLGFGGQLGAAGNLGALGGQNLGVQGGIIGQQIGQFGNLGGQFGLQGGNTSQLLITLITQVVGRPQDWAVRYNPVTGEPINPVDDPAIDAIQGENNNLGYYPPALALVVKAPSRIHNRESTVRVAGPGDAFPLGALPKKRGDRVARGEKPPRVRVGGDGGEDDPKGPPPDPKKVWQEALARAPQEPGMIIATADFLATQRKWDHAAEFLKANLRQGIIVKPWVYKALAIALRESGGDPEEIERAEVSAADLEPLDATGFLKAAMALAGDKRYDRALAFCRQAALLEPNAPHAYAQALGYAELAQDGEAMGWAAGNLLGQDWPFENQELQSRALQKLDALSQTLEQQGKADEAGRLRTSVNSRRRRDLVVKLLWQGQADLDLHVREPTETECSPLTRQTVNGGTLLGDSLADMSRETYVASEAFPGEYQVVVHKLWGRTLGNKAQLRIIQNQGTPQESEKLITLHLESSVAEPVTFQLEKGRRTETAYLAPTAVMERPVSTTEAGQSRDQVLNQLRALANPEIIGARRGLRGGMAAAGRPVVPADAGARALKKQPADRMLQHTRVSQFVRNSLDVTAQAVLSADRRHVRLSLNPVFTPTSRKTGRRGPMVTSSVFPGAGGRR
jgi:tetratricopeptide (TPR) repeat protein